MSSQRFSSRSLISFGSGRSPSCYGGRGGGGGGGGRDLSGSVQGNEKQVMQTLNDRLANFMNKVGNLEKTNAELELKINELLKGEGSQDADYESYYGIITDLRAKIMENAQIGLELDNARLAADDVKTKFDIELALRTTVEADVDNLSDLHEEFTMASSSMEGELELLQDDLNFMKKNHAEEVASVKAQISDSNKSEKDYAKQGPGNNQILDDMRKSCETTIANNKAEAEQAFQKQIEQLQKVAVKQDQAAASAKNEVTEIRQNMQSLQTELRTFQGQISCLEYTLDDTQLRKKQELELYLKELEKVERDIENAHMEIDTKNHDNAKLLDEKMKLDAVFETYRHLLYGRDSRVRMSSPSSSSLPGGMQSGGGVAGSGSGGVGGDNDQVIKTEQCEVNQEQSQPAVE